MRLFLCLVALLCALNGLALAKTPGLSGEWFYFGSQNQLVRIDEASGMLEDGATRASYVLLGEQGTDKHRAVAKGGAHPEERQLIRLQDNLLLFLGNKNPILLRKGARFAAPREKIRGRWRYAAQMNAAYYYDAEFDLDAKKMVEISRSADGSLLSGQERPLETLLDGQNELALRAKGTVYHFTRLGADFLVLEPSYASSLQNGYKILMVKSQAPRAKKQPEAHKLATAPNAKGKNRQKK
jgi:hypothetical protein